jgi:hypothetical protein
LGFEVLHSKSDFLPQINKKTPNSSFSLETITRQNQLCSSTFQMSKQFSTSTINFVLSKPTWVGLMVLA